MNDNTLSVIEMRKRNPCATLEAIANEVGITREAVRQKLKKAGLPTMSFRQTYICNECGGVLTGHSQATRKFCNKECYRKYTREHSVMTVFCNECGKPMQIKSAQFIYRLKSGKDSPDKKFYCDKTCYGRWFGKHYGFGHRTS